MEVKSLENTQQSAIHRAHLYCLPSTLHVRGPYIQYHMYTNYAVYY